MKKTATTFLLLLVTTVIYSQNIFSLGDRVFTDSSHKSYVRYEIDGHRCNFVKKSLFHDQKTMSGRITASFEGKPGRLENPILFNGEHIVYSERGFSDVSVGDKLYRIYYRVISNELDGLHYIDGIEFYDDYTKTKWQQNRDQFAVIAGNIVDTHKDDLEKEGYNISNDYMLWLFTGLNIDLGQSPFPMPEVHKEENLYFDLEGMVQIFLQDYYNHLFDFTKVLAIFQQDDSKYFDFISTCYTPLEQTIENQKIIAVFEKLESGVIAKSYGIDDDENIIIKVDPDQWLNADLANRWYILYHELGHDVLNFRHGQGGRMMFNYPTKKYSWEDFFNDRDEMFLKALNQKHPQAKKDGIQPLWSNY